MVLNGILIISLAISFITDIRNRKILNIVTLPVILFAFVFYTATQGATGFIYSGKGFLMGFGLLIIPYLLGGMGAGDVKLMAAIGSLKGTSFIFYSFIYTAFIGGFIALFLIFRTRGFVNTIKSFYFNVSNIFFLKSNLGSIIISKERKSSFSFPYGVAIVLGTLCTLVLGGF